MVHTHPDEIEYLEPSKNYVSLLASEQKKIEQLISMERLIVEKDKNLNIQIALNQSMGVLNSKTQEITHTEV